MLTPTRTVDSVADSVSQVFLQGDGADCLASRRNAFQDHSSIERLRGKAKPHYPPKVVTRLGSGCQRYIKVGKAARSRPGNLSGMIDEVVGVLGVTSSSV